MSDEGSEKVKAALIIGASILGIGLSILGIYEASKILARPATPALPAPAEY